MFVYNRSMCSLSGLSEANLCRANSILRHVNNRYSKGRVLTWVSCTSSCSMSGMPSPEIAEVGTMFTYFLGSGFFQYKATFRPCSFKLSTALCMFFSNSAATCGCWAAKVAWMAPFC